MLPVEALRESAPGATARPAAGGRSARLLTARRSGRRRGSACTRREGQLRCCSASAAAAGRRHRPGAAGGSSVRRGLGGPLRLRGVAGTLARQNAMRNPRRTASTATALMIGLTLVVAMSVFGSSLKASFGTILGDATNADLYVTPASAQAEGFSPEVGRVVADVPGVATASRTGWGEARFDGEPSSYSSVDPATAETGARPRRDRGSVADLGTDGVLVAGPVAAEHGWTVGDTVPVEFAATGERDLQVRGHLRGHRLHRRRVRHQPRARRRPTCDSLWPAAWCCSRRAPTRGRQAGIAAALADHPDAKVLDQPEYEQEVGGIVDKLLTLVSVMLLLAVVIALLGIVNTLALSVYERTRELGLLRAVGMTTGQVRAMVRWESVVISLIGAASGAVLGIGLGLALAQVAQGRRHHGGRRARRADRRVRRAGRRRRRPRGDRPRTVGLPGRRPAGGGHRLTGARAARRVPPGPAARVRPRRLPASRKASTAMTRRLTSSSSIRPSFWNTPLMCFSTARSLMYSALGDRGVVAPGGHLLQDLALAVGEGQQRRRARPTGGRAAPRRPSGPAPSRRGTPPAAPGRARRGRTSAP